MTTSSEAVFDSAAAEASLRQACAAVGVDPDGIELRRLGDHAVFSIVGGSVIARVGRGPERIPSVRREVAVAAWLAAENYPAARLVTNAEQPVIVSGRPITFWEGLANGHRYATTREMGQLLKQLHGLRPPPVDLPPLRPFAKTAARMERAAIRNEDRDFLTELAAALQEAYAKLDFVLPAGHIHGDFNIGNVLHDNEGRPKVIDLDAFAQGPREWDLMQTAIYYDSFGWHTDVEYREFAEAYGFDVRQWDGYPVLRSVRELLMITWLSQNAAADPRAAREVAKRVETIRTGGSRKDWAPF